MTVENLLSLLTQTHPPQVAPPVMVMGDGSTRAMQIPSIRRRHQSFGSTGSYDSGSSLSGSPPLPVELLALHLSQQQVITYSKCQSSGEQNTLSSEGIAAQKNVNPTRYKTELCRPFEESGYCKYGEKCQFAHGHDELRSLSRHPKYKTELCRTYHTTGFCPYGPRCHFIHNEDELKLSRINQQKQSYILQQMAQHVASQQVLSRMTLPPHLVYARGCKVNPPRALDLSNLPMPMSQSSPIDTSLLSDLDSTPSLSPTSSLLGHDEVFIGIPTPPPGFTVPPPTLTKIPCMQSPLDTFSSSLELALASPTKSTDSARCATPPKMGLASLPKSDHSRDVPISPSRLPFFTSCLGTN